MAMKTFRPTEQCITDRSSESTSIYLREISHTKPLQADEEAELARIIQQGGPEAIEARNRLVKANLRFVVSVAKQYGSKLLDLEDLISEGNYGLIKAAMRYDPTKDNKFITYAVWYIRQAILDAVMASNTTFRLPNSTHKMLQEFRQMNEDMLQTEQREVTIDEFCKVSGYSYSTVANALQCTTSTLSWDYPLNEDSKTPLYDITPSDASTDILLEKESMRMALKSAVRHLLSRRERIIISDLYGFEGKDFSTAEVAEKLGLSEERVRQLHKGALKKLHQFGPTYLSIDHFAA